MIGLALVTLVAIIGASVKQSFTNIIDDSVQADFLVQCVRLQQPRLHARSRVESR